ncbi:MAG: quinone oxidoreductase [Armatimonadetes bacterium]|nr:quinone oxidoreductase [Armatimonadota bacterium]
MKGIRVHKTGGPEVLGHEEMPLPVPGPKDVLIKIEASGVNFIDIYFRTGLYWAPLPFTPGHEGAGVVEAIGSEVKGVKAGEAVAYAGAMGSYAEYAAVPEAKVVKLPPGVDCRTGAAVMLQGMTAHYLSHSAYPIKPGDTALVHAAAGGVGHLLIQMAKKRGARVIGTVSTEEKADLARGYGADEVILYIRSDFFSEVRRLTEGRGVQVVYDSVGLTTFEGSLDCLAPRGYLILFGQSSGPVPPLDPQLLSTKGSLFLTRPTLWHYVATNQELRARAGDVLDWVASGALRLRIGGTFPLSESAEAHRRLESRGTTGKLLMIP